MVSTNSNDLQCLISVVFKVTRQQAADIEFQTRGQAASTVWFIERQWRLTSSRFGEVIRMTERRDTAKFCESLVGDVSLSTPALTHGKTQEPEALRALEKVC